jgi:hypothetical protein
MLTVAFLPRPNSPWTTPSVSSIHHERHWLDSSATEGRPARSPKPRTIGRVLEKRQITSQVKDVQLCHSSTKPWQHVYACSRRRQDGCHIAGNVQRGETTIPCCKNPASISVFTTILTFIIRGRSSDSSRTARISSGLSLAQAVYQKSLYRPTSRPTSTL